MADVATLGIRVQSNGVQQARDQLAQMQRAATGAEEAARGLERQAMASGASLGRAFGGALVTGALTAAVASLKSIKNELLEIDRVSRMTNLSLNQVNSLGVLGRMNGLTDAQVNTGLTGIAGKLNEARRQENDLTKLLDENNQKYKDREGNVIGVNAALDIAANLIAGAATNLDRIDIAKKLGLTAEWVPLLENGARAFQQQRAEAEALAGTIDQSLVNGAKQFDQAWNAAFTTFGTTAKAEIAAIAAGLAGLAGQASTFLGGLNQRFQGLFRQTYDQAPAGIQEVPITPSARPAGMSDATWRTLQSWMQTRRDTSRDFAPWERLRQAGSGGFRSTSIPGSGGGGGGGGNEAESSVDRALRQLQEQSALQQTILNTIGMDTATRETMLARQRALNVAARDNKEITDEQRRKIDEASEAYGRMVAAVEKAKEAQRQLKELSDFAKQTFSGFFQDIGQGLAQGKSLWDSFAQAGLNALNRIAQKLVDMAAQQLFQAAFGGLGGFGGFFGSLFGAGGSTGTAILAKGGVFANDNLQPFAKGGAFTNSIVTKPTVFPFAKGVGLMGEAGPEAIMPLRRTADGRLGVAGMGGGGINFAPVTNITVQGNADQNTVTALRAELDRRDQRLRAEVPALVTQGRRDRMIKSA